MKTTSLRKALSLRDGASFDPMEIWEPVYEGFYAVSNLGAVKRLKSGHRTHIGKKLSPVVNGYGYCQAGLSIRGKAYTKRIHSLVMSAFVGQCPRGLQINHKNGIKTDNRLENLEYITPRENIRHSIEKLGNSFQGENNGCAILTENQVREIRKTYIPHKVTLAFLAKKYGVSLDCIYTVIHKIKWKHIK